MARDAIESVAATARAVRRAARSLVRGLDPPRQPVGDRSNALGGERGIERDDRDEVAIEPQRRSIHPGERYEAEARGQDEDEPRALIAPRARRARRPRARRPGRGRARRRRGDSRGRRERGRWGPGSWRRRRPPGSRTRASGSETRTTVRRPGVAEAAQTTMTAAGATTTSQRRAGSGAAGAPSLPRRALFCSRGSPIVRATTVAKMAHAS